MKKNAADKRMKERRVVGDLRQWGLGGLVEKKTEIDWMADEVQYDQRLEQQLAGRVQLRLLKIK